MHPSVRPSAVAVGLISLGIAASAPLSVSKGHFAFRCENKFPLGGRKKTPPRPSFLASLSVSLRSRASGAAKDLRIPRIALFRSFRSSLQAAAPLGGAE